jgi:hypothetical protein
MQKIKLTVELHLDVAEADIGKLIGNVERATHGEFARRMWSIGDYIDFRVIRIDERVDPPEVFTEVNLNE